MDMGWVAALITALVGLFGLFFGRRYWLMLDRLVEQQSLRIAALDLRIDDLRREKKELYARLDRLEADYYALKAENESLRLRVPQ